MALSVRLDPLLEKEVELAAKRQGVTKTQFVIDALHLKLGKRNAYELMQTMIAEEERRYGKHVPSPGDFEGPYSADKARTYIRKKLEKKHGLRGAR